MRVTRLLILGCVLGLVVHGGCGGEDKRFLGDETVGGRDEEDASPSPNDDDDDDNDQENPSDPDSSLPPMQMLDAATAEAGATDGATDAGPQYVAENCGGVICAGTKRCVQDPMGAYCDCDTGFIMRPLDDGGFDCILDEECIFIRGLTHSCRHNLGVDPAVALSFTVEYCGGIPVPPEIVGDPSTAFELQQDDQPIDLDESAAVVVPTTAELFVTLALDVSGSVLANEQVLSPLVGQMRAFVSQLERPADEPPITVSVLVFGRTVAEYVAPTVDLQAVDAALAAIETDQSGVTSIVQTNGTALYDAVEKGIDQTERLIELRNLNSQGGVLSSGTLVVVTDGNNESGAVTLNKGRITGGLVHVVSVGINENIDDRQLSDIGRDGSFLAPNPEDWQSTFDEIASRITDRLQSIYRVAYCSPSTEADHELSVTLANVPTATGLNCGFDAGNFIEQPQPPADSGAPPPNVFASCLEFITDLCDNIIDPTDGVRLCDVSAMGCGSECLPDECCNGWGECVAPAPIPHDCREQDELCRPGLARCGDPDGDEIFTCEPPIPVGDNCEEVGCEEGLGQCVDHENDAGDATKICQAVSRDLGEACQIEDIDDAEHQCSTLNCAKDPSQNSDIFYCRPRARMFDLCGGANAAAVCETGTQCKGSTCTARVVDGPCSADADCQSGWCDTDRKACILSPTCHFAWSEKVAQ